MPHTLTIAYQPALQIQARRHAVDELLAVADAALPQLLTLWRGLLTDVRQAVRLRRLSQALEVHLLEGRNYLAQLWEQFVEDPAWSVLPLLGLAIMRTAGTVAARTMSRLTRSPIPSVPDRPASQLAVEAYVGTEIRDMTATSLRTVQRLLREGPHAGRSPRAIAQDLAQTLGLTPHQQETLDRMRGRLAAQGVPAAERTRLLQQTVRLGLQRRAHLLARTESVRLAQMGNYQVWQAAATAGRVELERVRRYWRTVAGACADHCAPIPGMNPEGVGLNEQFQTPDGPLLLPPSHPRCRCSVATRLRGGL